MSTTGVAMAYERVAMLNIGTHNSDGGYDASGTYARSWALMGTGITDIDEALNPTVDAATYVSDKSETKTVVGYAPEYSFSGDVIKDSTVIDFLRAIGSGQKTGSDAEAEMVLYDAWDVAANSVAAVKYVCAISMESTGSITGGEKLAFAGTILGKGDAVPGTYNTSTDVFTAT